VFASLLNRTTQHETWQKIPWHDADFSRRMLAEHLNQAHDLASRHFAKIDQHVAWIQRKLLAEQPARILDLGCGPGFYGSRLMALGHTYTGLDISPASIAHAREQSPDADYRLGDIRQLDYGDGYDLVMMIYGEFNAFPQDDAAHIVAKAYRALKPGGKLLIEVQHHAAVVRQGQQGPSWHTAEQGLFADEPYLCLVEPRYERDRAILDHYVYTAVSDAPTQYTVMHQAYTDDEYRHLLRDFAHVLFYPSLTGETDTDELFVIVAER